MKRAIVAAAFLAMACGGEGGGEGGADPALNWTALPSDHWAANGRGLEYAVDAGGLVAFRGAIVANPEAISVIVATLPAGYRPAGRIRLAVVSNAPQPWVEIGSDGLITTGYAAAGVTFSLDGASFPPAP